MTKSLTLLSFLLISILSIGQGITVDKILSTKEEKVSIYTPDILSGNHLYLKMGYGSSTILNPSDIKKLKGAKIAQIDVVYSDHPQGDEYPRLTKRRIANIKKVIPTLSTDKNIIWRLIRQTDCSDKSSAQELFHGIVVTYRPAQTKELISKEIDFLDSLFTMPEYMERSGGWSHTKTYSINPLTGEETLISESDTVFFEGEMEGMGEIDMYIPTFVHSDSVVKAVLTRNDWDNMSITADLTGSMSPYTAQLLIWLKLNTTNDRVKQFVFFNDGDRTPDHLKVIGETGGIYDTKSSAYEEIEKLAHTTMRNGNGSDIAENDIEALLKTIALCPDCDNLILIADNWAPIKDISLMSKIDKPIKIILCGADYGINTEYLDLAKATGGSIHTMEDDLTELMKLNEGEELVVGGQTFKITKGKFVRVSKS